MSLVDVGWLTLYIVGLVVYEAWWIFSFTARRFLTPRMFIREVRRYANSYWGETTSWTPVIGRRGIKFFQGSGKPEGGSSPPLEGRELPLRVHPRVKRRKMRRNDDGSSD